MQYFTVTVWNSREKVHDERMGEHLLYVVVVLEDKVGLEKSTEVYENCSESTLVRPPRCVMEF